APGRFVQAQQQVVAGNAGVVDDNGGRAEIGRDLLQQAGHAVGVGDVEHTAVTGGRRLRLRQPFANAFGAGFAGGGAHDLRAAGGQLIGNGRPDTPGRARYQRHAPGQTVTAHGSPFAACCGCVSCYACSVATRPARMPSASFSVTPCSRLSMRLLSPVSTLPGPHSSSTSQPAAPMAFMVSLQSTDSCNCATKALRMPSTESRGCASTLCSTLMSGQRNGVSCRLAASRSAAGFISPQWDGTLTASILTSLAPASLARSAATPTASACPATTTCIGALKLAGDTR